MQNIPATNRFPLLRFLIYSLLVYFHEVFCWVNKASTFVIDVYCANKSLMHQPKRTVIFWYHLLALTITIRVDHSDKAMDGINLWVVVI